jgi:signal transduction histidine kinase
MKFREFGSYLILPPLSESPERYLGEAKRLEWIFIAVRWLWVPIIFLMVWLHRPAESGLMMALGGALALCNAVACVFNRVIKTPRAQGALGAAMLAVDTLLAWGVILVFVRDFYTAAYAGIVYIVLEAAIRYGLAGSLGMAGLFVAALYGAFIYREAAFGVRFSVSGYVFWTLLMGIVAVASGAIVHEGKRQRALGERRLREKTLLAERNRIARDLHDTVLKTLQGLSLEARALGNRARAAEPSVKETASYIEDVCARTSREIREVIFDLRGDESAVPIGTRVSGMLDEWGKSTGTATDFSVSGEDLVLAPEPARQVLSIVAEALENVRRHAAALRVSTGVKISGGTLEIEIIDNGRGIGRGTDDPDSFVAEGRLGIAGMKERAELLGGSFSLVSGPAGTRVGFRVAVP